MNKQTLKNLSNNLHNITLNEALKNCDYGLTQTYVSKKYQRIIETIISNYKKDNIIEVKHMDKKTTYINISNKDAKDYLVQFDIVIKNSVSKYMYKYNYLYINLNKLVDAIKKEIKK